MPDWLPTLIGVAVGSVTTLAVNFINQSAQEKRSKREFARSLLVKRLELQERTASQFRRTVLDNGRGIPSQDEINELNEQVRSAFGESYVWHVNHILTRTRRILEGSEEENVIDNSLGTQAMLEAMAGMLAATQRELGIPALDGSKLFDEALRKQQAFWAESRQYFQSKIREANQMQDDDD